MSMPLLDDDVLDDDSVKVTVNAVAGQVHASNMRMVQPIDTYWLTRSTIDRCACGLAWDSHPERHSKPEWWDDVARR